MQVLNPRDKFLCDYEVYKQLSEMKEQYNWIFKDEINEKKKAKKRFTACGINLEMITRDLLSYMKKMPCSDLNSEHQIIELMEYLNTLDLVKVEKLQIVNSLPRSMVHLFALVEECDQRFDEETCEKIIEKINSLFPLSENDIEEEVIEQESDEIKVDTGASSNH